MRLLTVVMVLLALAVGGVFVLLENPDRFKSQITRVTESSTGYRMTIDGELSWRYWPPLAINVNQLSLARGDERPFASFDSMSIDVDLMPLLTQQTVVDVNDVTLRGGRIELIVDEAGLANWEIGEASQAPSPVSSDDSNATLASNIKQLSIRDVTLSYQDKAADTDYTISLQNLTTSELASDKPFDLSIALDVEDNAAEIQANISATGRMSFQADSGRMQLMDLVTEISSTVDGQRYPTLSMTTDGQWRPEEQALVLNRNDVLISTLQVAMTGLVSLAGDQPRFDGVISLESADVSRLAQELDTELPVTFFQLESDFGATADVLSFRTLSGRFDDSEMKGSATIALTSPLQIKADLRIDKLDTASYLGDSTPPANTATGSSLSDTPDDSEVIPVDLLRETLADATIRIGTLKYEDYNLEETKLTVKNDGQTLDVLANAKTYGGKVLLALNSSLNETVTSDIKLNVDGIDLVQWLEMPGLTGALSANSNLSFNGTMLSDVNNNLAGQSTFNVKDGSLDVRPLKSISQTVDQLMGQTSSVSEWPDVMPFDQMVGQHVFNEGTRQGQFLTAEINTFSLTALGGLDLQTETLDYDVTAMFKQASEGPFRVNKNLVGIRWPLSCSGSLNDAPGDLCFGNDGAIQDLVADIVTQDLKRRGSDKLEKLIEDKLPDEYKGIANDLLKNLFK